LAGSLLSPTDKTEFGYGNICGHIQENEFSRNVLEHCLNESDPVRGRHEES